MQSNAFRKYTKFIITNKLVKQDKIESKYKYIKLAEKWSKTNFKVTSLQKFSLHRVTTFLSQIFVRNLWKNKFLSNLSSNLEPLHTLSYQTNRADFADSFLVGLLVLGPAEGTVLFLLPSVDGLVGRRTNVERVELVVLQLVLVRWGLVACLKKNQNRFRKDKWKLGWI